MRRARTQRPAERVHPLLHPCRCFLTPKVLCIGCARWYRHYRVVTARLAKWRAQP